MAASSRAICAIFFGVGVRHVGEADAEAVVIGADQRIRSLQIDVVADHDQRALRVAEIDASGGVGEDDGANAHACEDADGEGDFLRGISFIEMHAALHGGDGYVAGVADDHASGVADGGRARERGDLGVGDAGGVGERVGEAAEAGAEDEGDLRAQGGAGEDELRGGVGECELVGHEFESRYRSPSDRWRPWPLRSSQSYRNVW